MPVNIKDKTKVKSLLKRNGFKPVDGTENVYNYDIIYSDNKVDNIQIVFNNNENYGKIKFSDNVKNIGRKTSSTLSKPEYLAQLFWYIKLVESGYLPSRISIEEPIEMGHKTSTYPDFVIYDENDTPFMVLDVKTYGSEYSKYKKELKYSKGQIPSYFKMSSNIKFVGVVTTDFNEEFSNYDSYIVSTKKWQEYGSSEEFLKNESSNKPLKNVFNISSELEPYSSHNIELTPKDLKELSQDSSSQIFHGFLTILRKHGISDKTNAFNKVLNLFIAKIVDEFNTPNGTSLKFQNLENESLQELNIRMGNLYSQGLREFIKVNIDTDKDFESISKELESLDINNKKEILTKIEHLFNKINSNFQFKDIYDEDSYNDNLQILKELVDLISPYKFKYAKKQQFLGDFFENILSNGFKQEAGQFFTPVPLAHFMVDSLPIDNKTRSISENTNTTQLLPKMIDFSSGSGHFLTEYMDKVQQIVDDYTPNNLSEAQVKNFDQFKNNPYKWSENYVYGLDIDYRLVKTSKVSSFLNGDGDAIIRRANGLDSFSSKNYEGDLQSDRNKNENFDILIANPPYHIDEFSSDLPNIKTDFTLGKYVTDKTSEIEALFVERASQLLKPNGLMSIILPASILSTDNKLYVEAKKLLFEKFEIEGIMKNPSQTTFAATNVETITIFGKRRDDEYIINLKSKISDLLNSSTIEDISLLGNEKIISDYLKNAFGKTFSLDKYNELVNGKINDNNIIKNYEALFKKNKKINPTSSLKFNDFIREHEKERILFFALNNNHSIIVQTPDDNKSEAEKLMGYSFSSRRGHEGIHPRVKRYTIDDLTLLYGNNKENVEYLSDLIRNEFLNDQLPAELNIKDEIRPYFREKKINELIDFNIKNNNYKVTLTKALRGGLSDYGDINTIELNKVSEIENGTSVTSNTIQPGNIPVIAGGKQPAYYNNESNRNEPVITISQSGNAGYISYHESPIFASDCFTIKANKDSGYSTKDLFYLLKNKQQQIYDFATGSVQKHVYSKNMENFKIPDIKNDEKNTKKFIKSLVNKTNEQILLSKKLNMLQKKLIKEASEIYKKNKSELSSIGKLENNEIVKVKGGKRIPKEYGYAPFSTNHYYPVVGNFNLNSIDIDSSNYIDDETFAKIKNYSLEDNDVFISAAGTIGKVGVKPHISEDKTISLTENAHKISIKKDNVLDKIFLLHMLNSSEIQEQLKDATTKTGTPKLAIESLKNIEIPLISIEKQKDLSTRWGKIDNEIGEISSKLD